LAFESLFVVDMLVDSKIVWFVCGRNVNLFEDFRVYRGLELTEVEIGKHDLEDVFVMLFRVVDNI
jgi:hypothetical protein